MPRFYFHLNTGKAQIADCEGTDLPDAEAARTHATAIARDVMRNDGKRMLGWRVQVSNADHTPSCEVLFASVAEELELFPVSVREQITRSAHRVATLNDDIRAVRQGLRQLRATLAQAERLPYLAAVNGVAVASPRRGGVESVKVC